MSGYRYVFTYDPPTISMFIGLFIFVEAKVSKEPVLPFRILARRTPFFVCLVTIGVAVCNFGVVVAKTGLYRVPNIVAGIISLLGVVCIANLGPDSSVASKWLDVFPMGFGFAYMLNTTFVALMASVPHSDIPAVTGVLWLFRTAGQVTGVASTAAILQ
ncbi:hypothetical protein RQP46_011441 [Phenoliferia psychrophenolica]